MGNLIIPASYNCYDIVRATITYKVFITILHCVHHTPITDHAINGWRYTLAVYMVPAMYMLPCTCQSDPQGKKNLLRKD